MFSTGEEIKNDSKNETSGTPPEPTKEEVERLAEKGPFYFQQKHIKIYVDEPQKTRTYSNKGQQN